MATSLSRRNDKIGEYRKINPLLVQTKTTLKTAMHLAIKIGKPERALILLTETKGNWPEIISASLTSWYNFIGQGIERRDSTSSNVIHYAIQHKTTCIVQAATGFGKDVWKNTTVCKLG